MKIRVFFFSVSRLWTYDCHFFAGQINFSIGYNVIKRWNFDSVVRLSIKFFLEHRHFHLFF